MGRNVVDATNACRMRFTRGDIARLLLAAAERVELDFFEEAAPADDFVDGDFVGAAFAEEGFRAGFVAAGATAAPLAP